MNTNECRVAPRMANDYEHASIEKQLMGVAKGYLMAAILFILMSVGGVALSISIIIKGVSIKQIIFLVIILFVLIFYYFLVRELLIPYKRIPKRRYVLLDCLVLNVIKIKGRYGRYLYSAVVRYMDGTTQKVYASNSKIGERVEQGMPAVAVFFLDRNGNRRKRAYSLCIINNSW